MRLGGVIWECHRLVSECQLCSRAGLTPARGTRSPLGGLGDHRAADAAPSPSEGAPLRPSCGNRPSAGARASLVPTFLGSPWQVLLSTCTTPACPPPPASPGPRKRRPPPRLPHSKITAQTHTRRRGLGARPRPATPPPAGDRSEWTEEDAPQHAGPESPSHCVYLSPRGSGEPPGASPPRRAVGTLACRGPVPMSSGPGPVPMPSGPGPGLTPR